MIQKMLDDNPPCPSAPKAQSAVMWPHRCCSCELWTSFLTKLETRVFRQTGIQLAFPDQIHAETFRCWRGADEMFAENSATALCLFGRLLFPHQSWCNVCSSFIIVTVYSSEDDYSESGGFQAQTITGPWRGAQQPITGWTDAQNDRKFQVLLTNEQT